jgi:hypothetical protein
MRDRSKLDAEGCPILEHMKTQSFWRVVTIFWLVCPIPWCQGEYGLTDYNKDVRHILSENCFHCHGFDEKHREANLRLDTMQGASTDLGGHRAITPGKTAESELIARIMSTDEDSIMPPIDSGKKLSESEKEILRRWIEQGAKYEKHWAFLSPEAVPLTGSANTIDDYIKAKLDEKGWSLSPATSPEKWLRRVSFDLLGIAPEPSLTDSFIRAVALEGEQAYVEAVDSLLESQRFGERMAQDWLDAARYADTHGFNNDSQRTMWRWRDWVIDAFNRNMPYDQFLTKQLAGDLLPNATLDDLIATGYCRNHVINSEGGIIDEEYRVEYVVDRVKTLGTSILGLTLECARCHDHKFDPITQKDFYRIYAFFNQVAEVGEDGRVANAIPTLAAPTELEQRSLTELDNQIQQVSEQMDLIVGQAEKELTYNKKKLQNIPLPRSSMRAVPAWAGGEHPLSLDGPVLIEKTAFGQMVNMLDDKSTVDWEVSKEAGEHGKAWSFSIWLQWKGKPMVVVSSMKLKLDPSAAGYGSGLGIEIDTNGCVEVKLGNRWPAYSSHVVSNKRLQRDVWTNIVVTHDGTTTASGLEIYVNGELAINKKRIDGMARKASPSAGNRMRLGRHDSAVSSSSAMTFAAPKLIPKKVGEADILNEADRLRMQHLRGLPKRTSEQERVLLTLYLATADSELFRSDFVELRTELHSLLRKKADLSNSIATTMVMQDLVEPRETFVLQRGQYNVPGEKVSAGVPEELLAPWPTHAPLNRLGLAKWLTQPDHPLTSRVVANRFWQHLFGVGLVKSAEDFGLQGEYPSHPELLDALARDFVTSGWDVKRMMKQLVLSKTYRQNSRLSLEMRVHDPENRLLARGPRFRLPAENIRDHLLDIGGLLRHRDGGPSVYPKQPEGLYEGIVVDAPYPGTKWIESQADDLYRRSVYTFWKRTVPFPFLTVFDAPDREVCVVRRSKTNTPLQALTLMNEPSMLDAARGLAKRMRTVAEEEKNCNYRVGIAFGFRLATGRQASDFELDELDKLLNRLSRDYSQEPDQARYLLGANSDSDSEESIRLAEHAALVALSNVILNLDETITKD